MNVVREVALHLDHPTEAKWELIRQAAEINEIPDDAVLTVSVLPGQAADDEDRVPLWGVRWTWVDEIEAGAK